MKRNLLAVLFPLCASLALAGCVHNTGRTDALYQTSTLNALMEGVYDGTVSVGELKKNGDFGIGTFNALDGEMVGLDGVFYQVKGDGTVLVAADDLLTPFAVVKFFSADKTAGLSGPLDLEGLMRRLDDMLPTRNSFYAVRIEGTFPWIKTRSVAARRKPYPGLAEAVKDQSVFEFRDIRGTIIGLRCPDFVKGLNMPGYHFHFISADRKSGGHLLGCRMENATVMIDETGDFRLVNPQSEGFRRGDLGKDHGLELEKAER